MQRRDFLRLAPAALGATVLGSAPLLARAAQPPKTIRLDYAYYSPPSLVLRKFGWLEEDLKAQGTEVKWVLSAGSNRALEYLNSDSVDFGSTAGLAALLARANGNPVKAVYIYSRPEWTALAVGKDSTVKSITELKGKKIAATKGTDPICSCCARCTRTASRRATSRSSTCSTPMAALHWNRAAWPPGPGWIRIWPPANWKPDRA
jgi:sulfonate transport system substrate-binding protein